MTIRTQLKAGRRAYNDNHNEALRVRSTVKAGGMRRQLQTTGRKEDRLELLVVRAGLRAGRARYGRRGRR